MSDSLTRDSLAALVADKMGMSFSTARKFVDLTIARMSDGIIHDGNLKLSSFGTFHVHAKKERMGRNPKTGEEVMITPRRVVSFRASKNLAHTNERIKS